MEWVRDWIKEDEGFMQEARERALPRMRYLFYRRGRAFDGLADLISGQKSKVYFGLCTHCGKESRLEGRPEHNGFMTCPACGRGCITKADGRGTKHLYDEGGYNFIRWNKGSLYIIHCYMAFDYRRDKYKPEISLEVTAIWRVDRAAAESWQARYNYFYGAWEKGFARAKSIIREKRNDEYTPVTFETVKGSWLENSRLTDFIGRSPNASINGIISYICAYQKHENIANLINDRQYAFAREYIYGSKALANRLIDWKRARPHEMLRTQKEELPELERIARGSRLAALFYQKARAAGQRLTPEQIETLINASCGLDEPPMKEAMQRKRIPKALNYIERQYQRDEREHKHRLGTITMWRDYLNECRMLGYDLDDDGIYYPSDLMKAHERTMKLIKIAEDEKSRQETAARADKLRWMAWEDGGLCIRPAESAGELKDEGAALSHCVGSYAENYRKGLTAIFFIRRTAEPDKPYFTLELDERRLAVRQNRGLKNCDPPEEVKDFAKRWLQWLPEAKKELKKESKAA